MLSIQRDVPLAPYTTFKIGGPAREFVSVHTEAELIEALDYADEQGLAIHILAGGSNTLFSDEGFNGLVIHIALTQKVRFGAEVTLGSGLVLWDEINAASDVGLGGWESLAGVPGSVGGAVRGNAGAFGTEIKDVVTKVTALHQDSRELREFTREECEFDYRDSLFKQSSGSDAWIILSTTVVLNEVEPMVSKEKADATVAEREKRHLQNVACAGSYFMNPVAPAWVVEQFEEERLVKSKNNRVPAGWLIEKVGMKGATEGGACASLMHPNYIMNTGSASARDVVTLGNKIAEKIRTEYMTHVFEEVTKVGVE
jgi:UDP-N-acetylmuramate dehydrogenase